MRSTCSCFPGKNDPWYHINWVILCFKDQILVIHDQNQQIRRTDQPTRTLVSQVLFWGVFIVKQSEIFMYFILKLSAI